MRLRHSLALAGLFAFTPLTFSADGAVRTNEACAFAGRCCAEAGSTCVNSGNVKAGAYYSESGCTQQQAELAATVDGQRATRTLISASPTSVPGHRAHVS